MSGFVLTVTSRASGRAFDTHERDLAGVQAAVEQFEAMGFTVTVREQQ